MTTQAFAPGLCPGLTNDAYHSAPGISKSRLDDIAPETKKSPRHYWAKHVDPDREPFEPTDAMILGTAIHSAVLEPDDFTAHYVKGPKVDRRTKDGKREWAEFQAASVGKIILDADDYGTVLGCRDAVLLHPVARKLFTGGEAEQTCFAIDPETGALIKCRPDYLASGTMLDLKSTDDASEEGFGRSATDYRYDVQAGFYPHVFEAAYGEVCVETFGFVAVEKKWPHVIGIYYATTAQMDRGLVMAQRDLRRILECTAANDWPDFGAQGAAKPLTINEHRRKLAA